MDKASGKWNAALNLGPFECLHQREALMCDTLDLHTWGFCNGTEVQIVDGRP